MAPRRDPFEDIEELFNRLNAGFGDFGRGFGDPGRGFETEFGRGDILVDVADVDDRIVVTADVPGFEKEDIDVTVTGRNLTVSATSGEDRETENADYYRRERRQRRVSRTVSLPVDVDESGATATYENGVLTVDLPKASADDRGTDIDVR